MNESLRLNAIQQRFLDSFLLQKESVNELIQDCIRNSKRVQDLEFSLNEQIAINQKVMNENQQLKNANKAVETKSSVEFNYQYMDASIKRLNKANSELKLYNERLELEINQLKIDKESLFKERDEWINEKDAYDNHRNIFELQKLKIETDLNEINSIDSHLLYLLASNNVVEE